MFVPASADPLQGKRKHSILLVSMLQHETGLTAFLRHLCAGLGPHPTCFSPLVSSQNTHLYTTPLLRIEI